MSERDPSDDFSDTYGDRFPNIDEAINEGLELKIFLSGDNVPIAQLYDRLDLKGYGEGIDISNALHTAGRNFNGEERLLGKIDSGKKEPENTVDAFLLGGNEFYANMQEDKVGAEVIHPNGRPVYITTRDDDFTQA